LSDSPAIAGDWFVRFGRMPEGRLRLICFPNAGSSATVFRPWATEIPPDVELLAVQFPGRQKRIKEPPLRAVGEAVETLRPAVTSLVGRDTLFFGDCTGALVAYELIRALAAEGATLPRHLIVSCCRAPDLPPRHEPLYTLDDAKLTAEIHTLGFAPEWLLNDQATLRAFLPLLRCDFEMAEAYRYSCGAPLSIPITAIAGTRDRITPEGDVAAWRAHTSDTFRLMHMEASHDLAQTHLQEVTGLLRQVIGSHNAL
jgi:medium-chain acyl-[acyl-carrier-protein] hydrolase